jgi:hypothetical protein
LHRYRLFVQQDPLAQYQVDETGEMATLFPQESLVSTTSYVIMVRRGNAARRALHNTIGVASVALCVKHHPDLVEALKAQSNHVWNEAAVEGVGGLWTWARELVTSMLG